ncbi:MAG TPA: hypothetical protein VLF62_06095, partial [Candidatus Saccharimonadales bacterium]|nr:hypothetical protein [Candidatus Saccharimonadales bacterium]
MTGTPETHCTTVNAAVCGPCPLREITELQWLGAVGDADITPFYLGEDVVDVVLKGAHPDRSNTMEGAAALSDDIHLWAGGSAEVGAGRRHLSNGDYVDAVDEAAAAAASSPHAPAEDIPGP